MPRRPWLTGGWKPPKVDRDPPRPDEGAAPEAAPEALGFRSDFLVRAAAALALFFEPLTE